MEDVVKELEHRRRIQGIYSKTRDDFDSKDDYDNYLETVEDIIYKLTYNIDVADVEQQVQDYLRHQALADNTAAASTGAAYAPTPAGTVMQPAPLVQAQQDAEGRLQPVNPGLTITRERWQRMAEASGWRAEMAIQRALQEAFSSIFAC